MAEGRCLGSGRFTIVHFRDISVDNKAMILYYATYWNRAWESTFLLLFEIYKK